MEHPKANGDRTTLAVMLALHEAGIRASRSRSARTRATTSSSTTESARARAVQDRAASGAGAVVFEACSCVRPPSEPKARSAGLRGAGRLLRRLLPGDRSGSTSSHRRTAACALRPRSESTCREIARCAESASPRSTRSLDVRVGLREDFARSLVLRGSCASRAGGRCRSSCSRSRAPRPSPRRRAPRGSSRSASASSGERPVPSVKTRLCSSSVEITQTDGSSTPARGARRRACSRRRESCPAGVWLNETYWFSGACLKRVAVLIAVMICRVTQSSAKLRNDVSLSARKSRTAL